MKKLKIAHQLFALVGVLMAAFAIATYFQIKTTSQAIYDDRFDLLRAQVQSGISILDSYYQREKSGEMTHEAAQAEAFKVLSKVKFEPAGYLFGYDYDVVQRFHPKPDNIGKNMGGQVDQNGTYFSKDMVAKGRAGGGRTIYYWSKPGQPDDKLFEKGSYSAAFEPWQLVVSSGVYLDDLQAQINEAIWKALIACAIIAVAGIAAAFYFIRGISKPLQDVHQALEAVADENVALAIPHADMNNEVGMMAKATQSLQQKVKERHAMSEREAAQQMALDGERENSQRLQREETVAQNHVVSTIGQALEQIARGDLTVRCADLGQKYAALRDNFNDALSHLEAAMAKVSAKGGDIAVSKEEIRRASNDLSQRTERQAASLEETSAALDELTVAVRQTAEGAHEASKRVEAVSGEASRSDAVVSEAIEAMSGIEKSSAEIGKIIGVIDDIAFQTNLLALNAGVEAARAGESGKGFAVVAQEVRELAQRSAAAAKEIKDQIARSSGQVDQGVRLVGEAGEALKRISDQIKAANEIVAKIAHSASEQDTTLRSISSSMNQLDAATQQNAAMAEETTASAESLATDTDELLNLIRGFRVGNSQDYSTQVRRAA
ncbi:MULTISPECIES: methyl-accepting chemotaxis protein [unclassified Rhizobium]|uniref:methyl-accepting chemotaxis protein n=1 Tax=unclassified Rhizobium TaxID=2613769 RepID=UPI00161299A4|nr:MULTISPECIES: methyl-accepting chemotaxis protein [unclassified Rhizobium]MBB3540029.1 methyl-accepting chemotaxis protein [Rhizobium sp. BK399]MCS3738961.1 methyl-accepting chemotaxis protein [Rhizobium sp. BK661]MCS4090714.1 methyl-accepting chemotaxis protein [Rhizobium sp. BK176]